MRLRTRRSRIVSRGSPRLSGSKSRPTRAASDRRQVSVVFALTEERAFGLAPANEPRQPLAAGHDPLLQLLRHGLVLAAVETLAQRRCCEAALPAVEREADERIELVLVQRNLDQSADTARGLARITHQ